MQDALSAARDRSDARSMFELARFENDNNLMPYVKAGDVMYEAYQTAVSNRDSRLIYDMASYEGYQNIMPGIGPDSMRNEARRIEMGY
ncbi:MAG: hypothetical protein ACK4IX_15205, partial [Candidatus Sericytochromatia bacterium]